MSSIARERSYSTPQECAPPDFEFPFEANGDSATFIVTRHFKQERSAFFADKMAGLFQPGKVADHEFSQAWLIKTTPPTLTDTGLFRFARLFSCVPPTQTVPDSQFIPKPELTGTFPRQIGDFLVFKPDSEKAIYDAYSLKTVTADSGTAAATYPTGGNYTLAVDGDATGSLAFDATAGTVETALDGLTSVIDRGGVTLTGAYNTAGGIAVSFNAYAAATADGSSLTSTGTEAPSTTVDTSNNGYVQTVTIRNLANAQDWNGGTCTVTIFGQTTGAIAYNATAATIEAALNALSEVQDRGGCTVTLPEGQTNAYTTIPYTLVSLGTTFNYFWAAVRFTFSFANPVITATSSLTPSGSVIQPAITDGGIGQAQAIIFTGLPAGRTITAASHGITAGDDIFITADGSDYFIASGGFSVPTANTITLATTGQAFATATAITRVGKLTIDNYTPEPKQTRVKYVSEYYLPGVTPGIATADDIPLPTYEGDPTSLLAAIFAGETSINYQVGGLKQWRESPILERTITVLNASQL
jgi:hypothetical protein